MKVENLSCGKGSLTAPSCACAGEPGTSGRPAGISAVLRWSRDAGSLTPGSTLRGLPDASRPRLRALRQGQPRRGAALGGGAAALPAGLRPGLGRERRRRSSGTMSSSTESSSAQEPSAVATSIARRPGSRMQALCLQQCHAHLVGRDQPLPFRRGLIQSIVRSLVERVARASTHPKQSASRICSSYATRGRSARRPCARRPARRRRVRSWFASSQARQSARVSGCTRSLPSGPVSRVVRHPPAPSGVAAGVAQRRRGAGRDLRLAQAGAGDPGRRRQPVGDLGQVVRPVPARRRSRPGRGCSVQSPVQ